MHKRLAPALQSCGWLMLLPASVMRHLPFLGALVAFVAVAGKAEAAFEVQHGSGAAGCPSEAEVRALILADKPPQRFEQANVLLSIERAERTVWNANIRVGIADQPVRERTISLRGTCRELVVASAVAIRLALDAPPLVPDNAPAADTTPPPAAAAPLASASLTSPRDAPTRAIAPPPPVADPPAPAAIASPLPAPAAVAAEPTVAARAARSAAPVPHRPRWEGSIGGAALVGVAPDVAPAIALGAARVAPRFSLGGEAVYAATSGATTSPERVHSKTFALAFVPCWRAGALSVCAPAHGGIVIASAIGFEGVRTRAAPLAMAGFRLGVRFIHLGKWAARLDAAALVHLVRTRVAVDDARLWTMPPASVSAGISITRMFF